MKRETLAAGGVVGLSVLIASCCLGPALFLLFGVSVGALGSLAVFEPYRPLLIAGGGALLVYAGTRIFRAAPAAGEACASDACAPGSRSRRITRALFVGAGVIYLTAIVYPYVLAAIYR